MCINKAELFKKKKKHLYGQNVVTYHKADYFRRDNIFAISQVKAMIMKI